MPSLTQPLVSDSGLPERGEVWWAELDVGGRPVVVISRDAAIRGRRRTMIAACSTLVRGLPSELLLEPGDDPVPRPCVAQLDAVVDVPVGVLRRRFGRLSDVRMRQLCRALAVAVDCEG